MHGRASHKKCEPTKEELHLRTKIIIESTKGNGICANWKIWNGPFHSRVHIQFILYTNSTGHAAIWSLRENKDFFSIFQPFFQFGRCHIPQLIWYLMAFAGKFVSFFFGRLGFFIDFFFSLVTAPAMVWGRISARAKISILESNFINQNIPEV